MATLRITRKSHYANFFRKYKIYLDGRFLYSISDGETKDFTVPGGDHTVEAKIDWLSSNIFSFRAGDEKMTELEIGSAAMTGFSGIALPVLRVLLLIGASWLSDYYDNGYFLVIVILLLVSWYLAEIKRRKGTSLIFYFTAGRNQFLYVRPA